MKVNLWKISLIVILILSLTLYGIYFFFSGTWSDLEKGCLLSENNKIIHSKKTSEYPLILEEYTYDSIELSQMDNFPKSCDESIHIMQKWTYLDKKNELITHYFKQWKTLYKFENPEILKALNLTSKNFENVYYSYYVVGRKDLLLDDTHHLELRIVHVLIMLKDQNKIYSFSHEKNI